MTRRTAHPGRTPAQRAALDAIGCGHPSPIMADRTRESLLSAGLIFEIAPREEPFIGGLKMTIRQFEMPTRIHMLWCDAMSAAHKKEDTTP